MKSRHSVLIWALSGVVILWVIGQAAEKLSRNKESLPAPPTANQAQSKAQTSVVTQTTAQQSSTPSANPVGVTPEQRLEIARKLGAIFEQQDLEISAVAAGERNDTLVFASEMFGTADGRLQFMQGYRRNWESIHCQLGFKKVVLSKGALSFGDKEYDLHCPMTAAELAAAAEVRAKEAAELQVDFQRQGLKATVQVDGPNKDRLVISSDVFDEQSDRNRMFRQLKQSVGEEMCAKGLKGLRLQSLGHNLRYTDFKLGCLSSN